MKILLIYPYCLEARLQEEDAGIVPIGLYYVGALLKKNYYDVEILNWHNINKTPRKIEELLTEKKPDVIGFSILNANRWGGIEIARTAKQIDPGVKIVFGGIGTTFLWEHLLTHFKEIDFAVIGEGEYAFLELIKRIEKKDYETIEDTCGIAFRNGNKVVSTKPAKIIQDLDELPMPAKYFKYQHVSSTRGCPGNCTFCGSPQFWGNKVRFHSSGYFVDQLESLCKKGVTFFYFSDDTFTIKKDRVIEICKKILEKGLDITWAAISRVNYINEDILYWMRKAGCIQISYGVESGSEKIRDSLNKNIKTDQIKKAFVLATKYGILARAYFIYGSPEEDWNTIRESIDLIYEIKPLSAIFYILDIFPGTALYFDFKKRTSLTDDIWLERIEDIMYCETDPRLSQDLILAFGKELRAKYHAGLSSFVDAVELINDKEFYKTHSDFLSRLGMTFSHGDYSMIEEIRDREKIAERLFKKSLAYYPDSRAYLGLGIINQKKGAFDDADQILTEGIEHFPGNKSLNICMGITQMNLGDFKKALSFFIRLQDSKETTQYILQCYKELGISFNESPR